MKRDWLVAEVDPGGSGGSRRRGPDEVAAPGAGGVRAEGGVAVRSFRDRNTPQRQLSADPFTAAFREAGLTGGHFKGDGLFTSYV